MQRDPDWTLGLIAVSNSTDEGDVTESVSWGEPLEYAVAVTHRAAAHRSKPSRVRILRGFHPSRAVPVVQTPNCGLAGDLVTGTLDGVDQLVPAEHSFIEVDRHNLAHYVHGCIMDPLQRLQLSFDRALAMGARDLRDLERLLHGSPPGFLA
jgi:hypothetical protein